MSARGGVTAREIVTLAVPATLTALLGQAYRPLDQLFVGRLGGALGRDAQAALAAATFVTILATASYFLISAGAGPLVARATGADDPELRRRLVGRSLGAAGIAGVVLAVVGLAGADAIAWLVGLQGRPAALLAVYLRVMFGGAVVFSVAPLIDACFASMGNTWLPMLLQGGSVLLNAILTPMFLFGLGMHTEGAALGSVIAQTVTTLIGLVALVWVTGVRWGDLKPGPELRAVLRVGAPVALSIATYALVYWGMLATSITRLGDDVVAGLGIGFSALEAVSWPLYVGTTIALASIVGRRLGAGQPDEAWRGVRMVTGPVLAIGFACGLVFWFAGPFLCGVWASEPGTYEQAVLYASVLAWSQPFVAAEALEEGVLAGAGDTRKLLFGTVPFNLLRVPLAWFLAIVLGMGPAGVWWAINATTVMKAAVKGGMVVHGGWARRTIVVERAA